ncbi:MAG: hypothetical protein H0X27_01280 [Caulobacteraceae bacterium]|nr:hypothetical protein [Caulobacteraceae bacterium]
MLDRLTTGISDANPGFIDWVKTRQDIVDGVEVVFSAIKDRDEDEEHKIGDMFEWLHRLAEIAGEETVATLAAPTVGSLALLLPIAIADMQATEIIKKETATMAFAEGVVMGAFAESPDFIRDNFWQQNLPWPREDNDLVKQYYANGGLVLGYDYGRDLRGPAQATFFADLNRPGWSEEEPSDDQQSPPRFGAPDPETMGPQDWKDLYIQMAGAFVKLHITESS